jgi:hypothetical protein
MQYILYSFAVCVVYMLCNLALFELLKARRKTTRFVLIGAKNIRDFFMRIVLCFIGLLVTIAVFSINNNNGPSSIAIGSMVTAVVLNVIQYGVNCTKTKISNNKDVFVYFFGKYLEDIKDEPVSTFES